MGMTMSSLNHWTCQHCTLKNSPEKTICQACNKPRQGNAMDWACRYCSLENPSYKNRCEACNFQRNGNQQVQDAGTLVKSAGSLSESIGSNIARFFGFGGKEWTCSKCTLKNPPSQSKCAACDSRKPEVIEIPEDVQDCPSTSSDQSRTRLYPNLELELLKIEYDANIAQESPEIILKCPKCQTLLYDNASMHCTVCGSICESEGFKPRPFPSSSVTTTPESTPPALPGRWNCPGCTFANDISQTICEICRTEREVNENDLSCDQPSRRLVSRGPSTADPVASTSGLQNLTGKK